MCGGGGNILQGFIKDPTSGRTLTPAEVQAVRRRPATPGRNPAEIQARRDAEAARQRDRQELERRRRAGASLSGRGAAFSSSSLLGDSPYSGPSTLLGDG